jgi:hypothetical protein
MSRRQLRGREQAEVDAEAQHRTVESTVAPVLTRRERRERELEERYGERSPVETVPDAVVEPQPDLQPDAVDEPDKVETEPEPVPDKVETEPEPAPESESQPEPTVSVAPVPDPAHPESSPVAEVPTTRRGRRARAAAPAVAQEEPLAESPAADSTVAESPAADSTVAESPAAESPAADSTVAESPVADSTVAPEVDELKPAVTPDVEERMLAVANVETVPLEIELVAQHPAVEVETAEHIAAETVMSAEVDFAEPRVAPEPISALATSGDDAPARPVPMASPRVRRSVPVAELLSSSSGTFVSHARLQPIKRRVLAGFVMMIAALFVVSLSIPSLGFASPSDFASVQAPADVTDSQNLSVGEGPALNAVRDDFYAVGAPGSLYSTTNTYVSKESQKLAQELMAAVAAGRLKGSVPDHIPEIKALADGVVKPDCGIDLRILQVMVIAVRTFDSVAVSDINRKCTGQIEGGGTSSSHYINGGGHAVDFYLVNGASVPGADASTVKLAEILDPIMPKGSNLGQSECRASAGIALNLQNFKEFSDSCTHMHIDVGSATTGLDVNLDTEFK